jgi:hypothetical protein
VRNIYNEFFYVPKHEKIREKVMLTRVAATIFIVIACLVIMSITAYAYFSHDVTSAPATIESAQFEATVNVHISDSEKENSLVPSVITADYKTYKISDLQVGEWYTVILVPTEKSSAKTGFAVITANGCNETYYTQQLGVDERALGGVTNEIKFQIKITSETDVLLKACWGTSSYYPEFESADDNYITYENGCMENVEFVINNANEAAANESQE